MLVSHFQLASPPKFSRGMDVLIFWQYIIISYALSYHFTYGSVIECQSFEYDLPLNGRYCPAEGLFLPNLPFHECKLICVERSNCVAFNYDHLTGDCTHFTTLCMKAMENPVMSFAIFTPRKAAEQCYQWKAFNLLAWDRALLLHDPNRYVLRLKKSGNYYVGYYGKATNMCYARQEWVTSQDYISQDDGLPCETLWINEGCTVYAQKYTLGDKIPERAVLAGPWSDSRKVVVAEVRNRPAYYIEGYADAVGPFMRSSTFTILVVLWMRLHGSRTLFHNKDRLSRYGHSHGKHSTVEGLS